jgi:hypothetical protein
MLWRLRTKMREKEKKLKNKKLTKNRENSKDPILSQRSFDG